MKRTILTIICLLSCVLGTTADDAILNALNTRLYKARVKMVDEFVVRFNGEAFRHDLLPEHKTRRNGILMLFDQELIDTSSVAMQQVFMNFAEQAVADSVMLHFEDEDWFATVTCTGKYGKRQVSFSIILKVERRDSSKMFKWVISDVDGDIFKTSRDNPHRELFIMPNDHEQFFSSLIRATGEAHEFIDDYARSDFNTDALSSFMTLVRSGLLRIESVSGVKFTFLQVPGYTFSIKYFIRESMNDGWLISECQTCTDVEKEKLLKH